jgi:hypothetical protein
MSGEQDTITAILAVAKARHEYCEDALGHWCRFSAFRAARNGPRLPERSPDGLPPKRASNLYLLSAAFAGVILA